MLGQGQISTFKSYRLADVWGKPPPRTGKAAFAELTKAVKTTDALIFRGLDPAMRSRVFAAAQRSSNGMKTAADELLKDQIEAMRESGELEPNVADALLRICETAPEPENNFQVLNPSLSTRTDGASDNPSYFYDNKRPSPNKRAGLTMDMVKNYARSHGIVFGSPARGTRWR